MGGIWGAIGDNPAYNKREEGLATEHSQTRGANLKLFILGVVYILMNLSEKRAWRQCTAKPEEQMVTIFEAFYPGSCLYPDES